MTDWKKVGARSRSRGYRFEKFIEAELEWQRVPMSGSAGSAFGAGDVIDGYINGAGFWLAECKMRTKDGGSISIERKWIDKANRDAEKSGRFVVIVTGTKHQMGKRPEAYVFVPIDAYKFLIDVVSREFPKNGNLIAMTILSPDDVLHVKTSPTGGFCVRRSWLDKRVDLEQARIVVGRGDGVPEIWSMFTLEKFKKILRNYPAAWVKNQHREES
jgi:hypothetical protein